MEDKKITLDCVNEMIDVKFIFDSYHVNVHDLVNKLYNIIDNDEDMNDAFNQPLNTREDLFNLFCDKIEDALLELIDYDLGEDKCLLKYNLMVDDEKFFDAWRNELFDKMYKKHIMDN